ncbi:hypothetical protein JG687_00007466 [Phytophthora cactorum]|uniref:Amino acid transporter transmembrane domain-containing protein n=1 Tax=Phytophthora cactorum TaxID=29920 RepID=A0A8T1UK90_9STRA|nr:hypothetical protein JG687_00007466 [Phytophthora cactorum]
MLILGVLLLVLVAVTLLVTFVAVTWEHDMVQSYAVLPAPADLGTKEFRWRCWLSPLTRRGWRTSILRSPCPRITLRCPFALLSADFAKLATSLSLPKLTLEQLPFMFPQVVVSSLFLQLLGNSNFPVSVRNIRLKALTVVQLRPLDMSFPSQSEETPPPPELTCIMVLTEKRFLESEIEFMIQTDLFDDQGTSSFHLDDNVVTRASANLLDESFECSARNVSEFGDVSVVDVTGTRTNETDAAPLMWMLARATGMLQQQKRVPAQPLMCSCMFGEELASVPLHKKLSLQSWTNEEYLQQQTQPEVAKFAVNTQDGSVMTGILRTVGKPPPMSHENDNGVTEPLLPFKGRSNSLSSTPNVVYDRDSTEHVERGDVHVKNRPLRDSYLKQLGYTPLIFKPNDDDLLSDAFPYHQSIIPSKGSIRGSVFNLAGATLGAGALSLPYAVAVSGLGFAVAQLVLAAVLTVYTIRLLIRAEDITKLKSYEDLAMHCFGTKMTIFVEVNILVFCFGISVAYLVTLGDIITPLGELCFGMQSIFAQRWVLMTISCGTIMLPLSMMKDISSLQFSSILGVLSIIFLVVAVAIRSIMYASVNGIPEDISWAIDLSRGPNFMLSVPIVMFAFTCQVNVFSIYTELQRPCIRRMNKVVDRATLISFLVYLSIGVVAYLAFGPQLAEPKYKGNILLSFPLNDTLIAISRAAITFTVAVAFPLNIFPCRFTIDMMFFSNSEDSWSRHVAVTSSLVLLALLLAIFCPSINVVFGIIGGTCSTVVCFCFPAAFILKLEEGPLLGPKKIGPVLLFIGAIVIGFVGTGVTVWSSLLMPPA